MRDLLEPSFWNDLSGMCGGQEMNKNSEPKADGLKYSEIKADVLGRLEGGSPRSIRKRGYHRALKRGEMWALIQKESVDMCNRINETMFNLYAPALNELVSTKSFLLGDHYK